ncbi:hypothetical protein FHS25_001908 [Rhizobium laguerreae]|uniref:Uncharacterized protein n=1 Tax=Rhizobium laguerreae TaxID=1076926 RepID=A0ABR6G5C1_9HYPH|nr:hypothetical protein [Rhizobium laguerreae]
MSSEKRFAVLLELLQGGDLNPADANGDVHLFDNVEG